MTHPVAYALLLLTVLLGTACRREPGQSPSAAPPGTTPVEFSIPGYFPQIDIPAGNPTTREGIALGRMLYYDTLLSASGPRAGHSCSSCHAQALGFTVPFNGTNVLPHVNLAWSTNFLWTGKVQGNLEDIMRFEVEEFFQVDEALLRNHPVYPQLFRRALGTNQITRADVGKALAQWFRSLLSTNSRLDQYLRHETAFTPSELNGMVLYLTEAGDCFHCHGLPLLTDNAFHNIGLDSTFSGNAQGRFLVTGDPADRGKFKTPTLRNIALTAPYMHDGRFQTLAEVVEHYNSGVRHSPSLDPIMTKPGKETGLHLSPQQKADLVAFLNTFTDQVFTTDTALASPF